jgi:DNA-binding transcriptional LysR family regulator
MEWTDRIGNRIRLRDLHVMLAVAECGSMSKAAARLAISHPVVSKTISDLEHSLGVRLFDRNSQGVELTAYGKVLLNCGNVVFDEMRQGLRQLQFLTNPDSGDLRVGFPEVEIAGIIPSITESFLRKFPGVNLQVIHANTSMLQFHELRGRNVELLIGRVRTARLEDDLELEQLFDDSLVAVAGAGSHWRTRQKIELAELVNEPWILPPYNSVAGPYIADIFRADGLEAPEPSISTLSHQLTTSLIATGRFIGLLNRTVVVSSGAQVGLKVLPVAIPPHKITVDIVTIKNRTLSPLAEAFIQCAREVAKPFKSGAVASLST